MTGLRYRRRVLRARALLARFALGRRIVGRWPLTPTSSPIDASIERAISGPAPSLADWAPDPDAVYPRR